MEPSRIRRTRRALGLSTEASYRFERGMDRWNAAEAMRRCLEIVLAHCRRHDRGQPGGLRPVLPTRPDLPRLARVKQVLGLELGWHEVEQLPGRNRCHGGREAR